MKIFLLFLFIGLSFIIIFKFPNFLERKKIALYYGLGILIGFILVIISTSVSYYFQKTQNLSAFKISEIYFLKIGWSILTIFFVGFFLSIIVDYLVNFILEFHKNYNEKNLNKNPVKFLFEKKNTVLFIVKIIFFLFGQCLPLYGVWFGKN